jgi:flagellar protein FlaG
MASEAISSSILLIGAVVGAAFLVTAILPAIFSAGDTFGTVSSTAESKIKTDFRIVNTYAHDAGATIDTIQVWMKNVGSSHISIYDVEKSDVFFGTSNSIVHYTTVNAPTFVVIEGGTDDNYWSIGETIEIKIIGLALDDESILSFTFVLPNSVRRSTTFSANV